MLIAAGVATDLFQGILQGLPPGKVYALIALGFVLTYKTSGVFNLAFGAPAYMSAVMVCKTHTEGGWPLVPATGAGARPPDLRRCRARCPPRAA